MHFPSRVLKDAHSALVAHNKKSKRRAKVLKDIKTTHKAKLKELIELRMSEDVIKTHNLEEALEILGFTVYPHDDGSLTVEQRRDEPLPLWVDDYLTALAPFVHTTPVGDKPAVQGGYIIWQGQGNVFWRDKFDNGVRVRQEAELQLVFKD